MADDTSFMAGDGPPANVPATFPDQVPLPEPSTSTPMPVERFQSRPPPPPVSPPELRDNFREVCETIVFVVVLVLILKTFVAEAFVIPTGSMATTLLGYHRDVVCQK